MTASSIIFKEMNRTFTYSAARMAGIFLLSAVCVLSSCKDEDKILTPLPSPEASLYNATVSSLTFYWDKVENATQYAYELLDPEGEKVSGGVTEGTVTTLTDLKDNTAYKFTLWAYGPFEGDFSTSPVAEISATTPAIVQLAAPVPAINLENGAVASWEAIPDAAYYSYTCASDNGTDLSGTVEETSVTLNNLGMGTYTFSVKAVSDEETFSDSEPGSVTFEIEKTESWKVNGTFDDGAGNTWDVTMIAWSNGAYTLENWYNIEGYDLEFSVNDDTSIDILNCYEPYLPNIWVMAGFEEDDGLVRLYTSGGYSSFAGNKNEGGYVWFYSYKTGGYAEFTWIAAGKTIDDLVGTYTQNSAYAFYYNGWDYYSSTNDVTITKVDDTTVSISGFIYEAADGGYAVNAKVDTENSMLTIEPQQLTEWYALGGYDSAADPVTVTWGDGVLTFGNWCLWYDGYYYAYNTAAATLTKK